jgi:hypothetical protein
MSWNFLGESQSKQITKQDLERQLIILTNCMSSVAVDRQIFGEETEGTRVDRSISGEHEAQGLDWFRSSEE